MLVKLTEGGFKDVSILEVTPDNYIVPKGEEHLYHAILEVKMFDKTSGERISKPRIQKFGLKTWDLTQSDLKKQGYTITLLNNPKSWLNEQSKLRAQRKQEAIEAKAKQAEEQKKLDSEAQQKKIDEAVASALKAQAAKTQEAIDKAVASALKSKKIDEVKKPDATGK